MEKFKRMSKYFNSIILVLLACVMLVACGKKKSYEVKGFENQVQTLISANFYIKMKQLTVSTDSEIIKEYARNEYNVIQLITAKSIETKKVLAQERKMFKGDKTYGEFYNFNTTEKTYTIDKDVQTNAYIYKFDEDSKYTGKETINGEKLEFVRYETTSSSYTYFYKSGDKVKYFREVSPVGDITYEVKLICKKIPQSAGLSYDIPKGYTLAR